MICQECGTDVDPSEYHPRAFCVLYNAGIDPYEFLEEAASQLTPAAPDRAEPCRVKQLEQSLNRAHNLVRSVFNQGGTVSDAWREDADLVLMRDTPEPPCG